MLWAVVEYRYHNAETYERERHYSRKVTITSLTRDGAEKWYLNDKDIYQHEKRFREGDDWFSFRDVMWIRHIQLERLPLSPETPTVE